MICKNFPSIQLGSDESDFTDKIAEFRDKEDEWPEDWGDDKQKAFDENGFNLLHYSIVKGYSNAVTMLLQDLKFGKSHVHGCSKY